MKQHFDFRLNSRYLGFLFKQNSKMMLVMSLFYFLIMPFSIYTSLSSMTPYQVDNNIYAYVTPLNFGSIFFIMSTILVPCILMSFIMNRNKMDTYQSLPIRKQDLFYNHFISILIVVLLPFILNWIISILVVLTKSSNFDSSFYLLGILKVILFSPILVGVSLFAFINSGRFFDGLLYAAILHASQFFSMVIFGELYSTRLFGLANSVDNNAFGLLSFDSSLWNWLFTGFFSIATIIWIVLGFVLYFINQYLYINRKVENIDESSVNNWFLPLVNTGAFFLIITFMLIVLMGSNSYLTSFVLPLLLGLVFYLVVDAISNRGFHNFIPAITRYAIVALISVLFVYSVVSTGLFGETKKVLAVEDVDTILVSRIHEGPYGPVESTKNDNLVDGMEFTYQIVNKEYYQGVQFDNTLYTSQSDKQSIIDGHLNLIDTYYAQNKFDFLNNSQFSNTIVDYNDYARSVFITYIKDKKIVLRREYNIPLSAYEKYFKIEE